MASEAVADTDQLEEGEPFRVELAGTPICVVLLSPTEACAVQDTCTHQGQSLAEGHVTEDDEIVCPAHASTFDLHTGEARGIPAVDPVATFPCEIHDGAVWVDAG
ncbi:Rieske (2Fe-2S) protein [Actinomycetospora termitidis]|uniref:Rieske 2Fe-2S domain-containing protein n=1 Tax=Actinomycetospora termitidis TaxID=3053470 RepID=A0ABT7MCN8_9PSEU|nr:Rieske 2Fe-2S domain-containing protein [Actinomycetospora sp. Odt1-22]MDL5158424.1 Rieske 2Fe-2S domain-containing protein [Actinomycetospora sp. Odt1-22]